MTSYVGRLSSEISRRTGISSRVVKDVLDALPSVALDLLMDTGRFRLPGVMDMSVHIREPQRFRDVTTGEYRNSRRTFKIIIKPDSHIREMVYDAANKG